MGLVSSAFAFLHHAAAFSMVAALAVQFVLVRGEPSEATARKLARADMAYGLSATVLLVVGLLRVFYFEKGAAYYFHNAAFLAKLALFVLIALLSFYPTLKFISWRKKGIDAASLPAIRRITHMELAGIVLILLFAALMADGIGYLGN
jgi:putative membrane protein